MPTTKKKKTTKTAKGKTAAKTTKKACTRTCCKKGNKDITNTERWHVYIVTALSFIAAILLCADVAIMNVS